ncbi:MAG: hypothetical protein ABI080_05140 [Candidatus Binatia bacterium]
MIAALAVIAIACGRSDPAHLKVSALTDGAAPPPSARADAVRVRYQLRNVGGRPLGIDGIAPACGCRPDSRLPESLAPGASTFLDVECRAPGGAGETIRELRLRTTDPLHPETTLRVALNRPSPGPAPAALYFGYVQVGESVTRDVVLPVAVTAESFVSPLPELAVEILPARTDGTHVIRVRFTPRASGIVRAVLALGAVGTLPVTAVGYDRVMAFPAEVVLPETSGASGLPAVALVGVDATPLAIARVDYPPGISGEVRAVTPGRQLRLVLRGRGTPGAASPAAIRLYGASGSDPILTIPVVGATTDAAPAPPA